MDSLHDVLHKVIGCLGRKRIVLITAAVLAPAVFAATVVLGMLLRRRNAALVAVPWAVLTLGLTAGALTVCGLLWHIISQWRMPLRRFQKTLTSAREGEVPMAELDAVTGPLAPLARQVKEILLDLRRQKVELSQAYAEMRQRIAQRTDAMERLIGSLRVQANRDALTGLFNRRMFDQHLATLVDQAQTGGTDLCLLMLDLDNFKVLNDTLGHAAGDEFLRSVGQIIRSTIRDQDLAFRYGGDEFAVVLPDAGRQAGLALGQRLISLIDGLGRTHKLPTSPGVSAGMATLSEVEQPYVQNLITTADKRLYAFKQARKRAHEGRAPAPHADGSGICPRAKAG